MKVATIGAGCVGLVTGVGLAAKGHDVVCVELGSELVEQLNRGQPHIHEPGLAELLARVLHSGNFRATTDFESAFAACELVMIAVGTPSQSDGIDLRSVIEVSRRIGRSLKTRAGFLAVVVKSTVVPGTTDTLVRSEIMQASGKDHSSFGLGMNPEFLREGKAVADFMEPDRIVLGHEDERTLQMLDALYAPWEVEKLRTNTRTAELLKYANNVLLATQISAVNELANLATAIGGIDAMEVVRGVQLDRRWNPIVADRHVEPGILSYLVPGPGFGGSCFPKDLQALRAFGAQLGRSMPMLDAVLQVNKAQPSQVLQILQDAVPDLRSKVVLVLGLAFKPETDDVRESVSFKLIQLLREKGAQVLAHDPAAAGNFRRALGKSADAIAFPASWRGEVSAAEVIVIVTAWPEYRALAEMDLSGKIVFDARRMFSPADFPSATYLSIGRGKPR